MAITKIHPIKSTLNLAIKYITNEDKTDEKILVSSFNCNYETAHKQFENTRKRYNTRGTVLARHLIQSFLPGEVTPEKAHEIGKALCDKVIGDNYEYILTTHIDRGHIHNHILFNNVSFKNGKCYQSNKRTYHKIREFSDELCRKNGLIVIDEFYERYKKKFKTRGKSYYEYTNFKNGTSWKSRLAFDIDNAIIKAKDFEDFKKIMRDKGYQIKVGKHLAFKHKDKERFTRCKSIGEDYTEDKIKDRIKNNKYRSVNFSVKRLNKIIDIDSNTKTKNSKGYEIWARKHNLKTMASSISMLRKLGINTKEQLENHIKKQMKDRQKLLDEMKFLDKNIDTLSQTIEDVNTVNKYRKFYSAYIEDIQNPIFKDYEIELISYTKALYNLSINCDKLPTTKDILEKLENTREKKNILFKEYSLISDSIFNLVNIKNNYDKYVDKKIIKYHSIT